VSIPQWSAPNTPFVGPDGRLTYAANVFLRQVFERIGGSSGVTPRDLQEVVSGVQLGVFATRAAPDMPPDVGYINAFASRPQEQATPIADASSVICYNVFSKR
jgi:hypothetical protein